MLTERQIKSDLAKAKKYASELEEEAGRLMKLANSSLESVLDELRVAWKGDNAEKYIGKGEQLKEEIAKTAKTLKSIASTIRSNAQNTYNTEIENLRIYQAKQKELAAKAASVVAEVTETFPGGVVSSVVSQAASQFASAHDSGVSSSSGSSGGGHSSGGGRF